MKQQQHQQLQCQLLLHLHHRLLGPLQLTLDYLSNKLTHVSAGLQVCMQQLWHQARLDVCAMQHSNETQQPKLNSVRCWLHCVGLSKTTFYA